MSRIDELQRLHEKHMAGEPGSNRTATMGYTLFVKLHNSWPAIHRVLLAARERADAGHDDQCPAGYSVGGVKIGKCNCGQGELVEALRALEVKL